MVRFLCCMPETISLSGGKAPDSWAFAPAVHRLARRGGRNAHIGGPCGPPLSRGVQTGESVDGGPKKGGVDRDDVNRNCLQQLFKAALGGEGPHEAALLQQR